MLSVTAVEAHGFSCAKDRHQQAALAAETTSRRIRHEMPQRLSRRLMLLAQLKPCTATDAEFRSYSNQPCE